MVCWLFVGSSIFSAAFALLGGQDLVEKWVLSLGLSPIEFLILSQIIIFLLGWPLEWTEIIVIFMPIFVPLLDNFGINPLFFGLLVALNLQTAFLGVLPQRRCTSARNFEPNLHGHVAIHGHPSNCYCLALHIPTDWFVVTRGSVQVTV
jgi:hypothetical protein